MAAMLIGRRLLVVFSAALAVSGWLCACRPAAPGGEVLLIVDAAPSVQAQSEALQLVVRGYAKAGSAQESLFEHTYQIGSGAKAWPFRFALRPRDGDVSRVYEASISARSADAVVATVRVSSGYVARKTLALRLRFDDACLASRREPCGDSESCRAGECVSATLPARNLPEATVEELNAERVSQSAFDAGLDSGHGKITEPESGVAGKPAADSGTRVDAGVPKAGGREASSGPAGAGAGGAHAPVSGRGGGGAGAASEQGGGGAAAPKRCGNAVLDDGELCESGSDTPCPERCADSNPCTEDRLEGRAASCDARCSFPPITQPGAADGCCLLSANANTDPDCEAKCGNGALESGERCDNDCPTSVADCQDNLPCTRDELVGTDCDRRCVHTEITGAESMRDGCCPAATDSTLDPDCEPRCGNRVPEVGEQCDDGNKINADGCSAECQYDDNTATPGDDRPGYVQCGAGTCGPDAHCCITSGMSACIGKTVACSAPDNACDGPEDCTTGQECWSERYAFCAPSDQAHARGSQLCHIDAHCDAGTLCGSSGTCSAAP